MNVLRGWLLDNLGLKLTALLLALFVYLNVYTDRATTMLVSFPLEFTDLPDSLTLAGPSPAMVQAELHGTGKQLIGMRVKEPRLRLSLAAAGIGHYERAIAPTDLPIGAQSGVTVDNLIGPRVVTLEIDRKAHRDVAVRAQAEGTPAPGFTWTGDAIVDPPVVHVTGPAGTLAKLDTLSLTPVRLDGRRDTARADAVPERLPDWCTTDPPVVHVRLPVVRVPR